MTITFFIDVFFYKNSAYVCYHVHPSLSYIKVLISIWHVLLLSVLLAKKKQTLCYAKALDMPQKTCIHVCINI